MLNIVTELTSGSFNLDSAYNDIASIPGEVGQLTNLQQIQMSE